MILGHSKLGHRATQRAPSWCWLPILQNSMWLLQYPLTCLFDYPLFAIILDEWSFEQASTLGSLNYNLVKKMTDHTSHGSHLPPRLDINPPLLNSASPWATTLDDLIALYGSPYTGAITTRTAFVGGVFEHDDEKHQYVFFDPISSSSGDQVAQSDKTASLNSLGYSPFSLETYLDYVTQLVARTATSSGRSRLKPIIVSVAGLDKDVAIAYRKIEALATKLLRENTPVQLAMEINLSCPNIEGLSPAGYSEGVVAGYIAVLEPLLLSDRARDGTFATVPVGLKLPPYTYTEQFANLLVEIEPLQAARCQLTFLTSTNTLGCSLVLKEQASAPGAIGNEDLPATSFVPALPYVKPTKKSPRDGLMVLAPGLGGMAGAALHPLSLGNVSTLVRGVSALPKLDHIVVIGVGGVSDTAGFARMKSVGASAVGLATALGREGVDIFGRVLGNSAEI